MLRAASPQLDDMIIGEPGERAQAIRGFHRRKTGLLPPATIWLPHLGSGRDGTLERIESADCEARLWRMMHNTA